MPKGPRRGMWVWTFAAITAAEGAGAPLLKGALKAGITDLYLYVPTRAYEDCAEDLRAFNAKAARLGIRVWGLDGARAYFSDADGPAAFYRNVDKLVEFNGQAADNERFFGFQADNEPADRDDYVSFYNGIPDSKLTTSQASSRQKLMHDWLSMNAAARGALHHHQARFGAAVPHWLSHYEGEPIRVRYPTSHDALVPVMQHMMDVVDDYVIMSYNTNPDVVIHLVGEALQHAETLAPSCRPAVQAAVETECGIGARISYGDAQGKNSRDVVLQDVAALTQSLALKYTAFAGVSIHHFGAWQALQP